MQSGELDQVISLLTLSSAVNALGELVGWTPWTMVYAKCEPMTARELMAAGAERNPATLLITIHWKPNVPSRDLRIAWMGKTYQLTSAPIDVNGKHQMLQLMCSEIAT